MHRALLVVALFIFSLSSTAQASIRDLAPADEYFGRMKMSVLGIRNALDGLERRAAIGDRSVASMLALVDDAISDWRSKYPRDTWLRRFADERHRIAVMIARR
jgi:hypothetical protein